MKHISLPKKFIVEEEEKGKKAKVVIEPCFPGYGVTLGNALRRVLLSSLPGGAVTAVKIDGVNHEFSTIDNVAEDVVEIILNLKQLRVKVYSDEPVALKLNAKGEGKATGADVGKSSDAEIINKDQVIATLTSKESKLNMEITVAKGIGYVPSEEQMNSREKGEIGVILVDSIFTPVLNVGLDVVATRVGQKVDYDKIVLDIETDGTISAEEAVQKAAEVLANQFSWIMEGGRVEMEEVNVEAPVQLSEATSTLEDIAQAIEEVPEPVKKKRAKKEEKAEKEEVIEE
ncbi:MAG: DNA-directed RNA polymerase subunit alpha [Candidatus Buchananbacteria bacterium]|nr:DNA-directed RNA polymerase subunit alpha [Candidatus Buchananbacteria bacterium]